MEIGEAIAPPSLVDILDECPFDHDSTEPPDVKNDLIGIGGTLATAMNNGASTKLYEAFKPQSDNEKIKWGKAPQNDPDHTFYKNAPSKGRCVEIEFEETDGKLVSKKYPVSCSAHHLIPSQESLKGHNILKYMCKEGAASESNHNFSGGVVWSDVGYNTNGSENGVYLPGSYAVGGGRGGLRVWYSYDNDDDGEHGSYVEVDKLPREDFDDWLIHGKKGEIAHDNACWRYVSKAMKMAPGQFHDRHIPYSEHIVAVALQALCDKHDLFNILVNPDACKKCEDKKSKIEEHGIPAPYGIVLRLQNISSKLRTYLTAGSGSWKRNIYTSVWVKNYMAAVVKAGNTRSAADDINV